MNNILQIAKNIIDLEINGLQALRDSLDHTFLDIIELIENLQGRLIVSGIGKSGHIARKVVATLASTGTPAIFIHPAEASHGDLGMITKNDAVMLLSNSGKSAELNTIVDYCKRFDIKIISITRNEHSSLTTLSDIKIVLPASAEACDIDAPTTSTTMMLAFGDAVAVVLHQRRGFTKEDFKLFHPGGNIGARLIRVQDIMHKEGEMPLIPISASGVEMIMAMTAKRLGCVGVIDGAGDLMGIVTDGDLRRHIDLDLKRTSVGAFMTTNPVTICSEEFASKALLVMNNKSITILFVVKDKKPIGVLHMHDLLKAGVV